MCIRDRFSKLQQQRSSVISKLDGWHHRCFARNRKGLSLDRRSASTRRPGSSRLRGSKRAKSSSKRVSPDLGNRCRSIHHLNLRVRVELQHEHSVEHANFGMSMVTNARHIVIAAALALTLSIGIASSVAVAKGSHRSKIPSASNLILAPAKSLPTVGECARSIVVDVDGNVQELFCPNGDIRVRAWKYFAQMGSCLLYTSRCV